MHKGQSSPWKLGKKGEGAASLEEVRNFWEQRTSGQVVSWRVVKLEGQRSQASVHPKRKLRCGSLLHQAKSISIRFVFREIIQNGSFYGKFLPFPESEGRHCQKKK